MTTIFVNDQWEVNEDGLDSVRPAPTYEIPAKRLLERRLPEKEFYDWPLHVAEKTWVMIEPFIEAFQEALKAHAASYDGEVDEGVLERSLQRARKYAQDR